MRCAGMKSSTWIKWHGFLFVYTHAIRKVRSYVLRFINYMVASHMADPTQELWERTAECTAECSRKVFECVPGNFSPGPYSQVYQIETQMNSLYADHSHGRTDESRQKQYDPHSTFVGHLCLHDFRRKTCDIQSHGLPGVIRTHIGATTSMSQGVLGIRQKKVVIEPIYLCNRMTVAFRLIDSSINHAGSQWQVHWLMVKYLLIAWINQFKGLG